MEEPRILKQLMVDMTLLQLLQLRQEDQLEDQTTQVLGHPWEVLFLLPQSHHRHSLPGQSLEGLALVQSLPLRHHLQQTTAQWGLQDPHLLAPSAP